MRNPSKIGRIFYGVAIAAMGFLTMYYKDLPYFMIPPGRSWFSDHVILVYLSGFPLILAGTCIAFEEKILPASLLLGTFLLLIFCFYFIPYQLTHLSHYSDFGTWENAAKEVALSGGALIIAGSYPNRHQSPLFSFLSKLIPLGAIIFPLTIISFGINHFIYAREASDYMPSWIPNHLFWMYFTGSCLLGAGIAILLQIKPRLMATLLGTMIFIWVIILHIPKSLAAPFAENGGEVSSGFLALAYCGIAFVIAGATKKVA
jgi:uncharacterized membrane protein YphA (DoxX/SURF4 family)